MGLSVSLILSLLFLFGGCSAEPNPNGNEHKTESQKEKKKKDLSAKETIQAFQSRAKESVATQPPALILPSPYEDISVFDGKNITFSAKEVELATLLHSIADMSGLNLIIDSDVPSAMPVTLSVKDAPLEEVLDILMNISGCYYEVDGNILDVKQFIQKSFVLPYTHSNSSFTTELGGDVLNSATTGGSSSDGSGSSSGGQQNGIKGDFTLKIDNPESDFYKQVEKNIQALLSKKGKYTLNRFSGLLNVYDKYKNVQAIEKFIKKLKQQVNRQVLIEAKILEVVLNKNHSLGVSWEAVADNVANAGGMLHLQQGLALTGSVAGTITYTSENFTAIINALDGAGDVDTLSNPRIKVLSGQSAIISSGKLVPFWEKEVQTTQGTGGSASNTEVTYNRRDVLHGLSMGVTPTIMEDGRIMLNVVPITSSIEDVVKHYDEHGNVVASAPIMNIKEAGTVIYAKDNDLVLIGGLINNTKQKKNEKIPLLGDLPVVGGLFKRETVTKEKRELVILIRLKVIQ